MWLLTGFVGAKETYLRETTKTAAGIEVVYISCMDEPGQNYSSEINS